MTDLATRLRDVRLKQRKSQLEVAEAVGMKQPTYQALESGKNKKSSFLPAIANYLKVDVYWLLNGDESMLPVHIKVDDWDDSTPLDDDEVEIPFFKDFSFACGSGSINDAITHEKRRLRMSKATLKGLSIDKGNAVAATASGDSMSPTINDGDTIHIDLGRKTIKDGKIFAVSFGGLQYAKRLYNLPFGGVRIVSDNEDEFEEIRMTADEAKMQEFQIIGWIWQIAKLEKW